jgi:tripartite-type tricarboxylate transporter receptor subunit TctC
MILSRRGSLHLLAGALSIHGSAKSSAAAVYPSRAVRLIVPFPPAGAADIVARLVGQRLSERLGHPFVIENRSGGGTNIGTQVVISAPPDGHVLLLVTPANAINASLYKMLSFDFIRDIAPVASLVRIPLVMAVNPSFPVNTVPEFIAYAKDHPGQLNMVSGGVGVPTHVAGELFKMHTGIDMLHIPYRVDPIPDLLGGRAHVYFSPLPASLGYIRAGNLRALAVTTTERSRRLPNVPTIAEFVPGYEASAWFGIGAPRFTPGDVINRLNDEIRTILSESSIEDRLSGLGYSRFEDDSTAAFSRFILEETEKWAKVVKFAGVSAR